MRVIDISTIPSPIEVGHYDAEDHGNHIAISDTIAYLTVYPNI